jgi:hypothetical protein
MLTRALPAGIEGVWARGRSFAVGPPGLWHLDFEYQVLEDGSPRPFLMVAHHHHTGYTVVLWGPDLFARSGPPFPLEGSFIVCHHCPAEASCFKALGWDLTRARFVDTLVEFRLSPAYADIRDEIARRNQVREKATGRKQRGTSPGDRLSLKGILKLNRMARTLGIAPFYEDGEKTRLQRLAATGGPFTRRQKWELILYCLSDVLMTRLCLPSLIVDSRDYIAASVRSAFTLFCEDMRARGKPVWAEGLRSLTERRAEVRGRMITEWDRHGLYEGESFRMQNFVNWLARTGRPWPFLPGSDQPDTRKETFEAEARLDPVIAGIHTLRQTVNIFKRMDIRIDPDGRVRTDPRPFGSKTGRSQPSGSDLALLPKFLRKYVRPPDGLGMVAADYSQQEVLIAGVISNDAALLRVYRAGDCYVGLGRELGLIPPDGDKRSHPAERHRCKALLLGVLYLMSEPGLQDRLKISCHEARVLYRRLHDTFSTYFDWAERIIRTAHLGRPLETAFGWRLHARPYADSIRTRVNFLIQATGADILRVACLLAAARGLEVIATVHDAIWVQCPEADWAAPQKLVHLK